MPEGRPNRHFSRLARTRQGRFEARLAASETLALPVYGELTDEQITYVAGKVKQFLAQAGLH